MTEGEGGSGGGRGEAWASQNRDERRLASSLYFAISVCMGSVGSIARLGSYLHASSVASKKPLGVLFPAEAEDDDDYESDDDDVGYKADGVLGLSKEDTFYGGVGVAVVAVGLSWLFSRKK